MDKKEIKEKSNFSHRFCIAPMMGYTNCHFRFFLRQLSKYTFLYTEMISTSRFKKISNYNDILYFNYCEHPLALQLGGSIPKELAYFSKIAEQAGYDEINFNIGCPSNNVQKHMIGACLMKHTELVIDCVKSMLDNVTIPVTVKHRIGIKGDYSYNKLCDFVGKIGEVGISIFIIHARLAYLEDLTPKKNLNIPKLYYEVVINLKKDFPDKEFILNGGITNIEESLNYLNNVNGVMMGRAAYKNPYVLAFVDNLLFDKNIYPKSKINIILSLQKYLEKNKCNRRLLNNIITYIFKLTKGCENSKIFRKQFCTMEKPKLIFEKALEFLSKA